MKTSLGWPHGVPLWVLSCVAVLSCEGVHLRASAPDIRVEPASLQFGRTWVGVPVEVHVSLTNRGAASESIRLTVDSGFAVSTPSLVLQPGEPQDVMVRFEAASPGAASGELRVDSGPTAQLVPMEGLAVPVPTCGPDDGCRSSSPDLETGSCQTIERPDGTACHSACLLGGQCRGGLCIGEAIRCDDHDACTQDSCDSVTGCAFADVSGSCPASSDPCQAASCDPLTGCRLSPVDDGAACGTSDCAVSHVCLGGVCRAAPSPDGLACGEVGDSPCQERGVCQNHACVLSSPALLRELWSYSAEQGRALVFPGVASPDGDVYWLEYQAPSATGPGWTELVSVDARGTLRFRVRDSGGEVNKGSSTMLLGSSVVMVVGDTIQSRSSADGSLQWTQSSLRALAQRDFPTSPISFATILLAANPATNGLFAVLHATTQDAHLASWAFGLSGVDGAVQWGQLVASRPRGNTSSSYLFDTVPVSDETGSVFFNVASSQPTSRRLTAFDSGGTQRLAVDGADFVPVATHHGKLFVDSGELLSNATGAALHRVALGAAVTGVQFPSPGGGRASPLLEDDDGWVVSGLFLNQNLVRFDASTGLVRWTVPLSPRNAGWLALQPILTNRKSVLVGVDTDQVPHRLLLNEISADGSQTFSCPVPGLRQQSNTAFALTTLRNGIWTLAEPASYDQTLPARVHAFSLGGRDAAARGWVTWGGKMTKEGHPR